MLLLRLEDGAQARRARLAAMCFCRRCCYGLLLLSLLFCFAFGFFGGEALFEVSRWDVLGSEHCVWMLLARRVLLKKCSLVFGDSRGGGRREVSRVVSEGISQDSDRPFPPSEGGVAFPAQSWSVLRKALGQMRESVNAREMSDPVQFLMR